MTRTENLAYNMRRNMTSQEYRIYNYLFRQCDIEAFPQYVVDDKYIVDFFLPESKLCIELDGSQHYTAKGERDDYFKTKYLEHKGYRVAHYSNEDVNRSFYSVCEDILAMIDGLK